jgi:uroporphyrinogen-III synthase
MSGLVVLNTRPREQAAELSDLLRAAGYAPLEVPAIETVAAWEAADLANVLGRLRTDGYAWVVFSSRNAVRFFLDGLQEVGGSPADLSRTKLLAGTGTADALEASGLAVTHTLERFSAEAALSFLRTELEPMDTVLVPRAAEGRDELLNGLGSHVDAPICYRTQAVPPATLAEQIADTDIAAVIFASPSAVHSLVDGLGVARLARPTIACLGSTTAQAAQAAGLRVDRVAERTDLPSLVEAVSAAVEVPA